MQTAGLIAGGTTLVLAALAMKYPDRPIFTESRDDIPSSGTYPLIGITPKIFRNKETIHHFFLEGFEKLDSLTTTAAGIGMPRSVITIDPRNVEHILKHNFENYVKGPMLNDTSSDLLGHGIFNANGEVWKYQRKTASLIFNVKNFRDHFTEVFVRHIHYMGKHIFDPAIQTGTPVDFHDVMFKFTLDSFVELSFGVELHALGSKEKVPFASSFDACQLNVFQRFVNPAYKITEALSGILMPWRTTIQQHLDTMDEFAFGVIEKRRKQLANGEEYGDLLSRFMSAKNEKGEPLGNKELRDVVLNFVIAGRDTTAQALSWTFYSLMTNPQVEKKLLEEVQENITDDLENDPSALYEVIKGMKYTNAVLNEVLRLYPSVPANQKYALDDDIWPDGTRIKKNDYVVWSPWSQGRSTKVWGDDAKEFKPERWLTPEGDIRRESPGKWPAFHAGPRTCLGQNLATLEAVVCIVNLVRQYEFSLVPNQDITYQVSLTLPMKNGMNVYIKRRK
ncbi:cytochrome P450 [Halteromyces radiatus]|uniref:cytochrome P450 n=1 Tax=Halteromyces radiatus TaxID=101107 RepID=UPI002220729F|nr:cytochrome P450 [Halteromyces radiatus]KAI8089636.1 cytochrome P450 [Halteromyces radiatus]